MSKIVFTADDYGMSQGVNEAICDCIHIGILRSTNVMVNMNYLDNVSELLVNNISVGIHWNLTAGKSVLTKKEIPSLVDENGDFYSYDVFVTKLKQRKIDVNDILKELTAQYNKFVSLLGMQPSYWNTHQNIALLPRLTRVFFNTF